MARFLELQSEYLHMHPSIEREKEAEFIKISLFRNLEICQILAKIGQVFTREKLLKFGKVPWFVVHFHSPLFRSATDVKARSLTNCGSYEKPKPCWEWKRKTGGGKKSQFCRIVTDLSVSQ